MNKKPNHGSKINLQLNFNVLPLHVVIEKINFIENENKHEGGLEIFL